MSRGSPGDICCRLWAGGLDREISEDEVRKEMERCGEVLSVSIRSSARDTFAFVQFATEEGIQKALDTVENSSSLGEKVRVARSTPDNKAAGARKPPARDARDDSRAPPPRRDARDSYQDDRRPRDRGDSRGRRNDYRDNRGREPPRREQRGDSRDFRRGGGRCDRDPPPRRGYSPPPPRGDRRGGRSRTPPRREDLKEGIVRMAGKVPMGRFKISIENLPEDMTWLELKDLGRDYGPSLTFARTYRHQGNWVGMLEFKDQGDAERVVKELDKRRVQGSDRRLKAYMGAGPGGE